MDKANQKYIDNILDYETVENNNIYIGKILTLSQLETIDQLLLSFITRTKRKTAYVIGKSLDALRKNNQLDFFGDFEQYSDMLLAQRINHLVINNKIKADGNIKAIRFSEISI